MTTRPIVRPQGRRGPVRIVTGVPSNLRSFRWAVRELRSVRRRLPTEGTDARVPPAAGMGPRGRSGVHAAIAVFRPTCLEQALVVQAWVGGYTTPPDVIIGVRNQGAVEAHAWVDGPDGSADQGYEELTRLHP